MSYQNDDMRPQRRRRTQSPERPSSRSATRRGPRTESHEPTRPSKRNTAMARRTRRAAPADTSARAATPRSKASAQAGGHIGSIDGIRSLAIVAVVLYHMGVTWLPSGHMGVVIFHVLTGYLVTSSLMRRLAAGPSAIPAFWGGRLKRIWPSVAVMVILVTAICVVGNHVLLTKLKPDFLPSLLLSTNVASILRGASYFDQIGGPSPLTHLWYLGLDAQFCLVWPLVMLALAPASADGRRGRMACAVLAVVSAVAMALLFDPATDPSRVYYGPDTRAFAPMVGAFLAFAWPLGQERRALLGGRINPSDLQIEIAGAAALAAILVIMFTVPATSPFLYRGGMLLVAVLSALVIASAMVPRGILASVLSAKPFAWLGSRSYGLYLWHFPIIQFLAVQGEIAPFPQGVIAVVLSLAAAEASWRLVEQGLSGANGVPEVVRGTVAELLGRNGKRSLLGMVPGIACIALVLTASIGVAAVPDEYLAPQEAITSTGDSADHAATVEGPVASDDAADDAEDAPAVDLDNLPTGQIVLRESSAQIRQGVYSPVMIGDSVPGGAIDAFDSYFPTGLLDSYVGRRPDQMATVLNDYLGQGVVGDIVILEAFSNVQTTDEEINAMIEACGDRSVFIVNTHIPQASGVAINNQLAAIAAAHDNVTLIDWNSVANANPSLLYADGTHLTPNGADPYVGTIANAIARTFAESGGSVTTREQDSQSTNEADSAIESVTVSGPSAVATAFDGFGRLVLGRPLN